MSGAEGKGELNDSEDGARENPLLQDVRAGGRDADGVDSNGVGRVKAIPPRPRVRGMGGLLAPPLALPAGQPPAE